MMLTYYCKETNTSYKQGMNEIFVNFLLLIRKGLSIDAVYAMSKSFIEICLFSMFKDNVIDNQTFRPAQAMFLITKILLKYNNPSIALYLERFHVTPELYATSWFLTVFATKIPSLENTFLLWQQVLQEKDPIFSCYLAVAFLEHFQVQIQSSDYSNAAQAISKIVIHTSKDLKQIMKIAKRIKNSMPLS